MIKNYVGFAIDRSLSMQGIRHAAGTDYNTQIEGIRSAAIEGGIDTIVSVVNCGAGREGRVSRFITNSSVLALQPIKDYVVDGGSTPLLDSVGELIDIFESTPDAGDPEVAFFVQAITDGQENSSRKWRNTLANKIRQLQATDRWSFTFRVPRGYAKALSSGFNIPLGNILEWDTTERGMAVASAATAKAWSGYYNDLKVGKRATSRFYSDIGDIDPETIKKSLTSINHQITTWNVTVGNVKDRKTWMEIRPFVEQHNRGHYLNGAAFYELVKREDIQHHKEVILVDKVTRTAYSGPNARKLLKLPDLEIAVNPGDHGQWEIYVQSTSNNRKLPPGTRVIYWTEAVLHRR